MTPTVTASVTAWVNVKWILFETSNLLDSTTAPTPPLIIPPISCEEVLPQSSKWHCILSSIKEGQQGAALNSDYSHQSAATSTKYILSVWPLQIYVRLTLWERIVTLWVFSLSGHMPQISHPITQYSIRQVVNTNVCWWPTCKPQDHVSKNVTLFSTEKNPT